MSETRGLLDRIAALRRDLQQAPPPSPASAAAPDATKEPGTRLAALQKHVAATRRHDALMDRVVRNLAGPTERALEPAALPRQLTAQARRLLNQGRSLLEQMRAVAGHVLLQHEEHPLTGQYQEAAAMAEAVLRLLQTLPDSPGDQLRLCSGLDAILQVVADRITALTAALTGHREEQKLVGKLANLLDRLHSDLPIDLEGVNALAHVLMDEARRDAPLRFLDPEGDSPASWVACHGLTTARVAARVARADPHFREHADEVALAALLHDVGMLALPPNILSGRGPLDGEQRRLVEAHTRDGADLLRRRFGDDASWLADAAAGHHERPDGTGYPAGLRGDRTPALARLLAACDVYAALVCRRPYRAALEPRHALTETLSLAEQGGLDERFVSRLLGLSFYPVGTAVELTDGSLGVVVGSGLGRGHARAAGRPVVAVLVEAGGKPAAEPRHVDLGRADEESIVRALPADERRERLGRRSPRWAW